jgi:hypothetical protein
MNCKNVAIFASGAAFGAIAFVSITMATVVVLTSKYADDPDNPFMVRDGEVVVKDETETNTEEGTENGS